MPEVMKMSELKLLLSYSSARIPHMCSRSQLKMTLNVIYKAGNAKLIIFPFMHPGEAVYLWRARVRKGFSPRTADTSDPLFLAGEVRHMGPPHITHLGP